MITMNKLLEFILIFARSIFPKSWQFGQWIPLYLNALASKRTMNRVFTGPFRGLILPGKSYASVYTAKLVGCYEREIQFFIDKIIEWNPALLIDVGAAEGYYALGFALRLSPQSKVVAFEADRGGRELLQETATLNSYARLEINGYCTSQALAMAVGGAFSHIGVIMDCEGGEIELLDPIRIPVLKRCMILVETHELLAPGCIETLMHRFSDSHEITNIEQSIRTQFDYPFKSCLTPFLPGVYKMLAVYEHRSRANGWLFMSPNQNRSVWKG